MNEQKQRHPLLPLNLDDSAVKGWLITHCSEQYKHETKNYFDEATINDMARKSSAKGAEVMVLEKIMATVKKAIEGGNGDAPLVIEIPVSDGIKLLKSARQNIDGDVAKGYVVSDGMVYGIIDYENETMVFFDEYGNEVPERNRPLSARERQQGGALFMQLPGSRTGTHN